MVNIKYAKRFFLVMVLFLSMIVQAQADYLSKDWTLQNQADQTIQISSFKGQPVVLVFWATWCPYCKKLMPGIERLHKKYHAKGLKVIAVNIMEDWKPKLYWHNHEYTFDTVLKGDDIAKQYKVRGTPSVVFIDPDGKVIKTAQFSDPEHPLLESFAKHYIK